MDSDPGPARCRSWRPWQFFLISWVLLAVAGTAWTLATPLFGGPDEPAQVVRAVAVARGEILGGTVPLHHGAFSVLEKAHVPAYYKTASSVPSCFAFKPNVPASCAPAFTARNRSIAVATTYVGLDPPLYYALVGWPSLVFDGAPAVYAMRMTSVLICSAFLALGLAALRGTRLPRPALAAGMAGITPAVLFLSAVVNSSGLETATGFATWALLLPLVLDPDAPRPRAKLLAGVAVAVVLVNTRPVSGLLALLIVASLLTVATRRFWRVVRPPRMWLPGAALVLLGGAPALGWLLLANPVEGLARAPDPALADVPRAAVSALARTRTYLEQQIGIFGWLDTPSPLLTVVLWTAVLGAVVLVAVSVGRRQGRIAVLVCLALIVLVPVVIQLPHAAQLGLGWQGRYLLPYSVGLPLLACGVLLGASEGRLIGQRMAPLVVVLTGIAQFSALGWTLWRFAYGLGRVPLVHPAAWTPPSGLIGPLALSVASMAGLAWTVLRTPIRPARRIPAAEELRGS